VVRSPFGGLDRRRLRLGLLLFFLALAVPSAVLVYQAFGRLEWEGFHQQQVLAEELARRIDIRLGDLVETESDRGFADYAFLVVEGDPRARYLQRSPLSAYPPRPGIPGLIGYFQVDAEGAFSSPLLPRGSIDPTAFGLTETELAERAAAEQRLEQILSNNRLVERRRREVGEQEAAQPPPGAKSDQTTSTWSPYAKSSSLAEYAGDSHRAIGAELGAVPLDGAQIAFDRLNEVQTLAKDKLAGAGREKAEADRTRAGQGAVQQAGAERTQAPAEAKTLAPAPRVQRQSRREVGILPELEAAGASTPELPSKSGARRIAAASAPALADDAPATAGDGAGETRAATIPQRPPIRTFESEIDPFEVSRLAGGQIVLYRKVWRDGQRYTQGALIDPAPYLAALVAAPFREATLARTSQLAVTWRGEPLAVFPGHSGRDYGTDSLQGAPLYQTRLSAPFSDLGLTFTVTRLPLGPGAAVVSWVATALALVLCGGVLWLYQLGVRQIALIRQ
jgi:hypothetical protein